MGFAPNMYNAMLNNIQHNQLQLSFSMAVSPTFVYHPDLANERESETIYEPIMCGYSECEYSFAISPIPPSVQRCRKS